MKWWLLALLFAASLLGQPPDVPLRDETAGFDKIAQALVSAFDHSDILALGDDHWRKLDSDLRIALVRHPDFPKRVRSIVVEFGSTSEQLTLDRYIQGENVSIVQLEQVWKTTTQTGLWDSPVYADFCDAAGISVLKEQVLQKHCKALLIYGPGHLYRTEGAIDFLSGVGGGITRMLEVDYPGRTFAVITLGGPDPKYQKFEQALKTQVRPVLVSLQRAPFRDFTAEEFIGSDLIRFVNGRRTGVFQGSGVTLSQLADACIYLGIAPDVATRVGPKR